jgi:hypothetical protein
MVRGALLSRLLLREHLERLGDERIRLRRCPFRRQGGDPTQKQHSLSLAVAPVECGFFASVKKWLDADESLGNVIEASPRRRRKKRRGDRYLPSRRLPRMRQAHVQPGLSDALSANSNTHYTEMSGVRFTDRGLG